MKDSILQTLKEKKEALSYIKESIVSEKQRIKEFQENEKLTTEEKHFWIKHKKEMVESKLNEKLRVESEIVEIETTLEEMLKYFRVNKPLRELGRVLKLLSKTYDSPFKAEGLKGFNVKLYKIINFAIENDLPFYLQFKTLETECLKVYDSDLKKWV